jgi:hypothetical protein
MALSATNSPQLRYQQNEPLLSYQHMPAAGTFGQVAANLPTLRGLQIQKSPVLAASNANHILNQQLHSIEDEAGATGAEDDEGEDLIKSINSLLNKGKQRTSK